MRARRRDFLRVGTFAAAGAAAGCAAAQPDVAKATPITAMLQFSGLLIHGRWPAADPNKPYAYSGWDALLLADMSHVQQIRIPLANVKSPSGYKVDRYIPGLGVWDINNTDVVVKLDGTASGDVTGITGKRPIVGGMPAACPDPSKDDEYLDITWLADFTTIFGDGTLKSELKGNPKDFPAGLVGARVRLPQGSMACARPTLAAYEKVMLGYKDVSYTPQFTADLTRCTSKSATSITLELVSFANGSTTTIELIGDGAAPIVVSVENHDPLLGDRALKGKITHKDYWDHHFKPYYRLLKKTPSSAITPVLNCCSMSCDPPFYCIPPGGNFA